MVSTWRPIPGWSGSFCCASSPGWLGPGSQGMVVGLRSGLGAARRLRGTPSGRTVASSCADERLLLGSAARKVALHPRAKWRTEGGLASPVVSGPRWGGGGLISICRALSCHLRRADGGHGGTWARRPQGRTHGRKPSGYQRARRPLGRVLALVLCGVCPGLLLWCG